MLILKRMFQKDFIFVLSSNFQMARTVEFNEYEIIEKAMNVFWKKGYQATSMQDLVDAMQINRSSIYNTIGDKHQLFMKCISSYFDNVMTEIKEKVAKESSAKQALIDIINDKARWIIDCEKGCLGIKTVFEIASEDNEVRKLMSKNNEIFLLFLAEVVQKAIDEKELDGSEDSMLMAEYIMTSFTGWKQSYILDRNPIRVKKMSEYLIKQITR